MSTADVERASVEKTLLSNEADEHAYGRAAAEPASLVDSRHNVGIVYASSLIGSWMLISTIVILWNAKLLQGPLPYPITLSCCHMLFQTGATRLMAKYAPSMMGARTAADAVDVTLPANASAAPTPTIATPAVGSKTWSRTVLPIGVLFAVSLWLSNLAYQLLSVPFIQMIKSGSPIAVMLTSFAFGLQKPTVRLISIILLICSGVLFASLGEADFHLGGFLVQCLAIAVEATRLALIQLLLHGSNMSPLASLHSFAPVCFVTLVVMILPVEGLDALRALPGVGLQVLIPNAALTFLLNVAAIYLVAISSLVLSLSKVAKDIALIFGSMILMGHHVALQQWFGYGIALLGLVGYKFYG